MVGRFPRFSRQVMVDVFPLPLLFLLNTVHHSSLRAAAHLPPLWLRTLFAHDPSL